jgi:hypothetical protein
MDDLKRQLYMRAAEMVASKQNEFICYALEAALLELGDGAETAWQNLKCLSDDCPEYFFPEFVALNDGKTWLVRIQDNEHISEPQTNKNAAWFVMGKEERKMRLQVISTILEHR